MMSLLLIRVWGIFILFLFILVPGIFTLYMYPFDCTKKNKNNFRLCKYNLIESVCCFSDALKCVRYEATSQSPVWGGPHGG